jgi:biopolymer transport protein ExbD
MAFNLAAAGGSADPDVLIDINTTPLIDVMLVLLVMLIITIPVQLHAVSLNMPVGTPPPPPTPPEVVRIDIDRAGTILWNSEILAGQIAFEAHLAAAAAQAVQPELHVRPDKRVPYKSVAAVMAAVQKRGLNKVGIVGHEQFL